MCVSFLSHVFSNTLVLLVIVRSTPVCSCRNSELMHSVMYVTFYRAFRNTSGSCEVYTSFCVESEVMHSTMCIAFLSHILLDTQTGDHDV